MGEKRYGKSAKGHSVYATEHSTTTIYLRPNESKAYRHFLNDVPKDKIVSIVSDSYDIENAVKNIFGKELKDLIMARTAPTVIRPDSGNPVEMSLKVIQWIWDIFGGTTRVVNGKEFKILDPHVRVIYGDGINLQSIREILQNLVDNGFSVENIIFGMGGKLLQGVDRDTFQQACKLAWAIVDGEEVEIYKDPANVPSKKSKAGKLILILLDGKLQTVKRRDYPDAINELILFFEDGVLYQDVEFREIVEEARK